MLTLVQWHHMTATPMPVASQQKSDVAPHFDCLNLRKSMVPLIICWHDVTMMPVPMATNDQEVMLHLTLIVLISGMQYCFFKCHGIM